MKKGMCTGGKHCLAPQPCPHLIVDHKDYLNILRRLRALPGVKKVFVRSGIRFDYLMADPDETFFKELVEYHVSGQLKVALSTAPPIPWPIWASRPSRCSTASRISSMSSAAKPAKNSTWCPT